MFPNFVRLTTSVRISQNRVFRSLATKFEINEDDQIPKRPYFWMDPKNARDLLEKIAKKLEIKKPEDWAHITTKQLKMLGAFKVFKKYDKSIFSMLASAFPGN